jgi:hypothetical protein
MRRLRVTPSRARTWVANFSTSLARIAVATAIVVSVLSGAEPAAAHGTAGQSPVDHETRVVGTTGVGDADNEGVHARVTDLGEHLEVTSSRIEIVVLGYEGEPYLRVGPDGVWRNERSPATFLNRSVVVDEPVPPSFDATADPEWIRIGRSSTARWHDHRLHPSGREPITRWRITFVSDGREGAIVGTTTRLTPPSIVVAVALVVGFALVAFLALRTASPIGFVAVAVALLASTTALSVARWTSSTESIQTRLAVGWPVVLGLCLVVACARARHGIGAASPWFVFGFAAVAVAFGFALMPWLVHARVPAAGSSAVWRAVVASAIGAGSVGVAGAARRLRVPPLDHTDPEASAAIRRSR